MVKCIRDTPSYDLTLIAKLASSGKTFGMLRGAAEDALGFGMDDDDVRGWFAEILSHVAIKDCGFIKSKVTEKYPPGTCSDYYQARIDQCGCTMFVKFAVYKGKLIVTSFKDYRDE